jgi:hypothetical protein
VEVLCQKPLNTPLREHGLFTLSQLRKTGEFNGYFGRNVDYQKLFPKYPRVSFD